MRKALTPLVLLTLLSASTGCASREKGRAVSVTRQRESVAPCRLIGRVTGVEPGESQPAEEAPAGLNETAMRQQAADLGADTLLILPGGAAGEAYVCGQRGVMVGGKPDRRPTPGRLPVASTPTPSGVWPATTR